MVLKDLVRSTLEGLILTCCDAADGTLFCFDTRADGRKMCGNKNTLLVRVRESEHHIAQLCSSSVIGEKLKSSSATVCPTEADSKCLVETASIFAETLGGDSMPDLSAWMTRYASWSVLRFQVKSESPTALPRVLENCRIQDRIESATKVDSELRQRAWITTTYRKECDKRTNSMQALDNAKTDENALGYMKVSKTDECEIKGDEWKKSSDQAKEPSQKKYEAAKAQHDRDPAEGQRSAEEGNAATERVQEGLQGQGWSQETCWWSLRSAPGREARGDQEKSIGGPQDHRQAGERWKSLPADERQKMDAKEIPCTSSSTVNTTMMRSRLNDAIWRDISDRRLAEKTRSAIPSLCARNEVKDTSLYVVERIDIVMGLMPKRDMVAVQ